MLGGGGMWAMPGVLGVTESQTGETPGRRWAMLEAAKSQSGESRARVRLRLGREGQKVKAGALSRGIELGEQGTVVMPLRLGEGGLLFC